MVELREGDVGIGIDPSLNSSGIVVLNSKGNPINYEAVHPLPLLGAERLAHNYQRFCTLFSTYRNIKYIAYEKQVSQMRFAHDAKNILDLAENIGMMKLAISQVAAPRNPGLLVLGFTPNQIKKFATDNARADKDAMMAQMNKTHFKAVQREIPESAWNDVADAYFAARYANKLIQMGEKKLDEFVEIHYV